MNENRIEYRQVLEKLENYLELAIRFSNETAGATNVFLPTARAHQLFIRMTVSCTSIIRLSPDNKLFRTDYEFWDFFSIASLTRNFIENYLTFFYIGVDDISKEEASFRTLVFNYHSNLEKFKIYQLWEAPEGSLKDFEENLPKAAEKLKLNRYFQSLPGGTQRDIIKGRSAMYLSRRQITQRLKFSVKEIEPLYKMFSNHTHSSPFGFFPMSNDRGRGNENEAELTYITWALEVVTKLLCAAILDLQKLFPVLAKRLDSTQLEALRLELKNFT